MTISGKEMLKLFLKAGWKLERTKGSHHFVSKGNLTEVIPVHSKDLKKGTEKYLFKKLKGSE